MLAIIEAYHAGLLRSKYWIPNITSGIIVGIIAAPLAMAFAIASGANPEQGLYTAIIAGLVVAIFGGSRIQIAGPTGAFIVILANITAHYGITGLQIATLLAGFMLLVMGMAKLGNIVHFIPRPVIVGFTTGIGVIIFINGWKDFFGLSIDLSQFPHFHEKLWTLIQALPQAHFASTLLACFSLTLLLLIPRIPVFKAIPAPLVALIVITLIQHFYQFDNVATIGSLFGELPRQLPHFQFPSLSFGQVIELIGPAFTIAFLGAVESLLSAVVADGMARTHHNANQELIGQGLANILCPLFGGFAATGAIARTATNVRSGGNSPLAAIIHSLTLVIIILLFAPFAAHIPLCVLAAILFVVAYNMSDINHFVHLLKYAPRSDISVLLTTFLLTVFTDLVVAVNAGITLAVLLFVYRMSQSANIDLEDPRLLQHELMLAGFSSLPNNLVVYTIQGPFFFGTAKRLEGTLNPMLSDSKIIIFRLKNVPFIDFTGLETFCDLLQQLRAQGAHIYLCEANTRVSHKLDNINVLRWTSEAKIHPSLAEAFKSCLPMLKTAS